MHQSDLAVRSWILDDGTTELTEWRARRPEWAEDGGGGWVAGLGGVLVCDLVNEGFDTEDVADTLALVTGWRGDLADGVDEVDAGHPLIDGELRLAEEVMEVAGERAHDVASAGVGLWADGINDMLGEVWVETRLLLEIWVGSGLCLCWWDSWCSLLGGHCGGYRYIAEIEEEM